MMMKAAKLPTVAPEVSLCHSATVSTADSAQAASTCVSGVIVAPAADPDTHSSRVRLMLGDPALRPGMAVTALFPVAGNAQLWLPTSALVQRGEVSGFYVLVNGQPQLRQVRIGERSERRVDRLRKRVLVRVRDGAIVPRHGREHIAQRVEVVLGYVPAVV